MKSAKKKSYIQLPKISIVIPMRNSSSTIVETLKSIRIQDYPIHEVLVVNDKSTDDSIERINDFKKKHKNFPLKVLNNNNHLMIARSQDRAVKLATSEYIIFTHSDCRFSSPNEISKLMKPIVRNQKVIATYGGTINPLSVWEKYTFWEKCLLSRDAGRIQAPGLLGKADCIQKKAFLSVGGHDTRGFDNYGCEDADLHLRLKQKGKIVATNALVEHLHYTHSNFSLGNLFWKTKFIAEGYGRFIRVNGLKYGIQPISYMFIKPLLTIGSLIPIVNFIFIPLLAISPFLYYSKVFTSRSTVMDPRIILLPFIGIILMYYQTFWMIQTYFRKLKS